MELYQASAKLDQYIHSGSSKCSKRNGLKSNQLKYLKGHKLINTTILYQEMEYVYIMLSVRVRVEYLSSSHMSNIKWVSFVKFLSYVFVVRACLCV